MRIRTIPILACAAIWAMAAVGAAGDVPPNPYGIAGWGRLGTLGMPADCLDYDWNGLHPGTLAQMCRPNHYYDYIGIPPRYWGWNEATGQINDATRFAEWISANPGRVWIISNEPDLVSQDGLSREQYAQMYKTYHAFIGALDPTATFCIGAITGGSTTESLAYTKGWYQYVLDYYKTAYGEPMPIDIWNIHSYCGAKQIEDPDQPIRDFVAPFVEWCHTVDGGRYAGAEVWITELPIGEWMGALHPDWTIWFAQRYLPRLERAGIARWFWFVSASGSEPEWQAVALVQGGAPSPIGQAYAALAHGYPNEIVPVAPYVPAPPPPLLADDFSAGSLTDPWMIKAGEWALGEGALRQSRVDYPWNGETCVLQHVYDDFELKVRLKVNQTSDPNRWAGVLFHLSGRFHSHSDSGYLVYLRRNGSLGLHNKQDGTVAQVTGAAGDASQWQDLRIRMKDWRIQVWLNDVPQIDWTDRRHLFDSGYVAFQVLRSDASYDDFEIVSGTPASIIEAR